MGGMVREEGEGFIVERFECRTRILGFYFVGDVEHADSHIQIFKFYCIFIDTDHFGNNVLIRGWSWD